MIGHKMKKIFFLSLILLQISVNFYKSKAGDIVKQDWRTYYELSGYRETPRYDETIDYCMKLAAVSPRVHYTTFGKSPQGRDLPLLIYDYDGLKTPEEVRAGKKAVILIEACIHSGECEGKDAGLMLFRDIAILNKYKHIADNVTVLFIPIFSVDAHERFSPYNRINQNGPKEMGWRTTAQNLNLNRDFMKADAIEMKAWLKLFNKWLPDFFIDSHTTDGADYRYVLTYGLETLGNMDEGLTKWQKEVYLPEVKEKMKEAGFPIFPYVAFRNWHDPRSGLRSWVAPPMLSEGYTAIQNRPGLLIETHMLKPYKQRVEATYEMMINTIDIVNRNRRKLQKLNEDADEYCSGPKFRKNEFPVQYEPDENDSTMTDFAGIGYDIEDSGISGGKWFRYNGSSETFHIPYFNKQIPKETVKLPEAYILPPEWPDVIQRLDLHGIKYSKLSKPVNVEVVTYKFKSPAWRNRPYESRQTMTNIEYDEIKTQREYPAGSLVIDMNQRTARVIAYLLEPKARDSFVYWGFFNVIFEQKEYAESYVMEKMAREMLANDQGLKKDFEEFRSKNKDKNLSPHDILNWFYSKTPYWDNHLDMYPVGKIMDRKAVIELLSVSN